MSIILPIIGSVLLLGRTFFLTDYNRGSFSVYRDSQATNNPRITHFTRSIDKFQVIKSSTDVPRFLDIEPRLSLAVKFKSASVRHNSFILSSLNSKETAVQILVRIERRLTKEQAPKNITFDEEWKTRDPKYIGTHYIHSLSRGGDMVSSIIFEARNQTAKEKLNKAIDKHLGQSGDIPDDFEDRLDKIRNESGAIYHVESTSCSSCFDIFDSFFFSIKSIMKFKNEFLTLFNQTGKDRGTSLYMELAPLSNLSSNFPVYSENSEVIDKLEDLEEKFDDIKIALNQFHRWDYDFNLSTEDYKKLGFQQFYIDIKNVNTILSNTLIELDVSANSSVSQFDAFYSAYGASEKNNYYRNRFEDLKKKAEELKN